MRGPRGGYELARERRRITLGEIVRTYTTVSRHGGQLKLLNLTKRITDLLAITKLLTVFETECRGEPDCSTSQVIEGPIHFSGLCEHHALPF